MATVTPTQGNQAQGSVTFNVVSGGVRVVADLSGLAPGEHGIHVHEKGDCSAPDGSSAGGHFNPDGAPHGAPDAANHHAGDLGNITADSSGEAHLDQVFEFLQLQGPNSVVGRGLVIHAGKDDFKSQPSGDAGARVGCGVIKSTEAAQ
jgi:Cu-Zn family superoxide dismutase